MIKKIKISESQSVTINTNTGWLYVYKSAFGHDILPDLLPALQGAGQTIAVLYDDESKNLTLGRMMDAIRDGEMLDALGPFYGLELTTVINVLWAVVHNADKTTPPVEDWLEDKEIDFDLVVPELFEAIPDSMVSSKNVKWLKDLMKRKTENLSPSTQSQSEQQPED